MDDFTFPTTAAAAEPADPLCLRHHRRLPFPHFASSPLWFPSSPAAAAAVAAAPVLVSRSADMEEQEPTSDAERRAEEEGELVRSAGLGAGAVDEDKMDLLWENFNEELEALRRAGSCSKAAGGGLELTSDTESESESEPAGRGHGCAPMLRASSRAGGTGHYRRTSWVLLMRIFRRFFVVEKTISAARRQARSQ